MKFRLKALLIHLISSATVLTLILGGLYLGWYRWPGWYLTDVTKVVLVMIAVDVVLGPTLTFVIANKAKPRRELVRDLGVIVVIQLCALTYGSLSLWNGRPLYYAFSENVLQQVQAYDIDSEEAKLGREQNPTLAPHWYSLPRWIWAPLPQDPEVRQNIVRAAITGGDDVISMPRYYAKWADGLESLREQLRKVDDVGYFSRIQKENLKRQMMAAGLAYDQPIAMPLIGRGHPMLAIFDPRTSAFTKVFTVE
jgi:hypothetical protein